MWFAFICHTWSPAVFHFCLPHWEVSAMRASPWLCPCPVTPSLDSPWRSVYLCRMNRVHFFYLVWPLETFSFAPWGVDTQFCERKNCVLTSFAASNNQCLCMNLTHIYFMYYTFFTLIGLRFYRSLDFTPWKLMSWSVSLVLKELESCYDISKGRNQGGFCTSWFHVATVLWGLLPFLSQCL